MKIISYEILGQLPNPFLDFTERDNYMIMLIGIGTRNARLQAKLETTRQI